METGAKYVTVQSRGVLVLPADVRRRHSLDEPGTQVEVVERGDGVIELRPHVAVPADQTWFWTKRWQKMEREVDRHVERGQVTTHDGPGEMFEHLDRPARRR